MRNTVKPGAQKSNASVLRVKSSLNLESNSERNQANIIEIDDPVTPVSNVTIRGTGSTKLARTLSRSQDSLSQTPSSNRLKSVNTKPRPQSALGIQKPKFERKVISKFNTPKMNKNSIQRSASKDNIDQCVNRDREKENVKNIIHKKSSSSTVAQLEKDKKESQKQISDLVKNAEVKKAEIATLKMEIKKFKNEARISDSSELQNVFCENKLLRERLVQLGHNFEQTALSDTEKEMLLKKNKTPHSFQNISDAVEKSADFQVTPPVSFDPLLASKSSSSDFGDIGDGAGCSYNPIDRVDWDKQSNSSISEMSVACLQDRIMQMEENHYSTNEELQATLQELSDLQDQLTDLQIDNDQMRDEKSVMLESLCSQTEKLEECRSQICCLKELLFQQSCDGSVKAPLNQSAKEEKLLELLKSAEMEREANVGKCDELVGKMRSAEEKSIGSKKELAKLTDHVKLLQSTIDASNRDRKMLEKQLGDLKEHIDNDQIELTRVNTLLENERQKVHEVQKARKAESKSELDRLVDAVRKEKDEVEGKATALQEQLAISQCEIARLKEQISILQDESMVIKNNAKKQLQDMEYKIEQLKEAKNKAHESTLVLERAIHDVESKCQRHLEDKRELKATISDLQNGRMEDLEKINEIKQNHEIVKSKLKSDTDDWKQFQNDLLITVRVANDFKTEAQVELDRLMEVNESLRKKNISFKKEMEKLKATSTSHPSEVLSNVEQDLANRRQTLGGKRGTANQLSVRGLIESIENAAKQAKAHGSFSQSSSNSSLHSCTSDTKITSPQPVITRNESDVYIRHPLRPASETSIKDNKVSPTISTTRPQRSSYTEGFNVKSSIIAPGKENSISSHGNDATKNQTMDINSKPVVSILTNKLDPMRRNSYGDLIDKKDPLAALAKNGGSKRNALLKWCQNKVLGYKGVDVTNFSSSWNDGLAFCALLHSYLPEKVPYEELDSRDKKKNFTLAFHAAESVGITSTLNINDMVSMERPDWQSTMAYVTLIYKHFET